MRSNLRWTLSVAGLLASMPSPARASEVGVPYGSIQVGGETVVGSDIHESGARVSGIAFINQYWSLGLAGEAGSGNATGALENGVNKRSNDTYRSSFETTGCHCESQILTGYTYSGYNVNLGVHPFAQARGLRFFAGVGQYFYRDIEVGASGIGSPAALNIIDSRVTYSAETVSSQLGASYLVSGLGLSWEFLAALHQTNGTKWQASVHGDLFPVYSEIDDIVLEPRPKIALSVSYVFQRPGNAARAKTKDSLGASK